MYPEDLKADDGARAAERLFEREAEIRGRAGRDVVRLSWEVARLAAAYSEAWRVQAATLQATRQAEMRRLELRNPWNDQQAEQRREEGRERERLRLEAEVRARVLTPACAATRA